MTEGAERQLDAPDLAPPGGPPWEWAALGAGVGYAMIGIFASSMAATAATPQARDGWRLAAWVLSAAVFLAHNLHEHFRQGNAPRTTASHASLGVAVGAFVLAAVAILRAAAATVPKHSVAHGHGLHLALVVWPILLGIPAFIASWTGAALLARFRPRRA